MNVSARGAPYASTRHPRPFTWSINKHIRRHTKTCMQQERGGGACWLIWLTFLEVSVVRDMHQGHPAWISLKVPTDSQLLHHSLHLRPHSFSNTEILQTATRGADVQLINLFTLTVCFWSYITFKSDMSEGAWILTEGADLTKIHRYLSYCTGDPERVQRYFIFYCEIRGNVCKIIHKVNRMLTNGAAGLNTLLTLSKVVPFKDLYYYIVHIILPHYST